jgi:hypothetical protein
LAALTWDKCLTTFRARMSSKTYQAKLLTVHARQTCQGNLSRKTCSSVRGFRLRSNENESWLEFSVTLCHGGYFEL